jgi:hypothetical protein
MYLIMVINQLLLYYLCIKPIIFNNKNPEPVSSPGVDHLHLLLVNRPAIQKICPKIGIISGYFPVLKQKFLFIKICTLFSACFQQKRKDLLKNFTNDYPL